MKYKRHSNCYGSWNPERASPRLLVEDVLALFTAGLPHKENEGGPNFSPGLKWSPEEAAEIRKDVERWLNSWAVPNLELAFEKLSKAMRNKSP